MTGRERNRRRPQDGVAARAAPDRVKQQALTVDNEVSEPTWDLAAAERAAGEAHESSRTVLAACVGGVRRARVILSKSGLA